MSKFKKLLELAWVPKPFLSDLEWAVAKALVNSPSLQDNLPTIGHLLSDLQITQHRCDRDKVARLANDGITDGGLCVIRDGIKYVWDGHHRFWAAQRVGAPTCQMKTLELTDQHVLAGEAKEGMSVEDFCAQLRCRTSTLLRAMDSNDRRVYEDKNVGKFGELLEADKQVEWYIFWDRYSNSNLTPKKSVHVGSYTNYTNREGRRPSGFKRLPVELGFKTDVQKLIDCCKAIADGKQQKDDIFQIRRNSEMLKFEIVFNGKSFVAKKISNKIGKDAFSGMSNGFHM